MKLSDNYIKIVEWSEEDQYYVGSCPALMLGGVHGDDETKVYKTSATLGIKKRRTSGFTQRAHARG